MSSQDSFPWEEPKGKIVFPGLFSEAAPVAEQPASLMTPESLTLAGPVGHSLRVIGEKLLRL